MLPMEDSVDIPNVHCMYSVSDGWGPWAALGRCRHVGDAGKKERGGRNPHNCREFAFSLSSLWGPSINNVGIYSVFESFEDNAT